MTASGPEMYIAIMTVCFSDSYEALEETKAELRKMKLTDFAGENVVDCAAKILRLAERLDAAGEFEENLLCVIARIFEHTSDERLKLFTYSKYDKCSALVKKLKVNLLESLPANEVFTYEDLLKDFTEEYHMLVDSGRWSVSAGSKKSGEPELPAAYSAQITKSVNSALKMAGIGSGSPAKSKEIPTCTHCKKKGHTKDKCWQLHGRPDKQTNSTSPGQHLLNLTRIGSL